MITLGLGSIKSEPSYIIQGDISRKIITCDILKKELNTKIKQNLITDINISKFTTDINKYITTEIW